MKSKIYLLTTLAAFALSGSAGLAQGSASTNMPATTSTQAVFRVSFAATCRSFDSTRGHIVTTRLTDRNIIAQAVGGNPSDRNLTRNFALAYNATEDSLQVVDSNLQAVVDVIHFGGGAAIADNHQLDRFTFLFFPGQTNELGVETNVFGSAVITERTNQVSRAGTNAGPNITGQLQFFLTGGNVLGMTNQFVTASTTNALGSAKGAGMATVTNMTSNQGSFTNFLSGGRFVMTNSNIVFDASASICVATFTTTRTVPVVTLPATTTTTNGVTTTNTTPTTGTTNGATGTTGTNGMTTGGLTNAATGANIGIVPATGTVVTFTNGSPVGVGAGAVGITTTPGVTATTTGAATTGVGTGTTGITTTGATMPITTIGF